MHTKINLRLIIFITLLSFASAFSQTENTARAELSLGGGKTVYRTGEPIHLILSFTAAGEGYQLNTTTTKPASPVDEISITPDSGVFHWLDFYSGANRYSPDYSSITKLSETPTNVELALNQWIRFDVPGHYTVKIRTNRVSAPPEKNSEAKQLFSYGPLLPLTTNEVSFDIKPMSEPEEAQEVQKLSVLLNSTTDWRKQVEYAEELAYLTGDAATREKIKRFFIAQSASPGNYFQEISLGIFISKNQNLVIKLLEDEMRNPERGATFGLLGTLIKLRLMRNVASGEEHYPAGRQSAWDWEEKRSAEIRQLYLKELSNSLSQRTGKSLTTMAETLLASFPKDEPHDSEALTRVREIIIRNFDNLSVEYEQESLLRAYWDKLRDPALLPAIEKIAREYHGQYPLNVRSTALERLWDLSPERARPYFIEELKDPTSLVSLDILGKLNDAVLPETDQALLEQIRVRGQAADNVYLRIDGMRAARYASPAIYDELMKIYQANSARWWLDTRANLLAYFARYNEQDALPMIEKELANPGNGSVFSFLSSLTQSYYSAGINDLLKKRMEGDDPETVSGATYFMSIHGPATNDPLFRARLARWRQEWGGRIAKMESENADQKTKLQGIIERELVTALIKAKSEKPTEAEILRLKQSCLSKLCRQSFPTN